MDERLDPTTVRSQLADFERQQRTGRRRKPAETDQRNAKVLRKQLVESGDAGAEAVLMVCHDGVDRQQPPFGGGLAAPANGFLPSVHLIGDVSSLL